MNEWKKVKIGDVATIKHGFAFKGEFFSEQCNNSVVLTPGNFNINGGFKKSKPKYYLGDYPIEYVLSPNDLIVSMTDLSKFGDTLGYSAKIPNDGMSYLHNQRIGFIQKTSENIDLDYLYWLMRCKHYQKYIVNSCSGSTVKHTSPKLISRFEFCLPPLEEQKAIADVLSCLDDKIELNNKINKNLEEQAQALFKRWFVDFEFPNEDGNPYKSSGGEMVDSELGLIPIQWHIGSLGEYCKVKSGFAFKSSWWQDKGIRVIKIKNIGDVLDMTDCSFVSDDKVDCAREFVVKGGDILIAMTGATIGKFSIIPSINEKMLVNQRVGKFFLGETPILKASFLYCNLQNEEIISQIIKRGQGSAQPNISPFDIESIQIIFPSYDIINKFNNICYGSFLKIITNQTENQKLAELRDYLLPKLMSGEIRVKL